MKTNRLEAFSDGVIAIIITIMVLELKVPHGAEFNELKPLWPVFLSYALSFVFVGIYWNNHHHMLHAVDNIEGVTLWANLHLLFWLSLIPFSTAWMGENHFATKPVAFYGALLLMCSVAYFLLARSLIHANHDTSVLAKAMGKDRKGIFSSVLYALAIVLCFVHPAIAMVLYVIVALVWLIPDQRIEKRLKKAKK